MSASRQQASHKACDACRKGKSRCVQPWRSSSNNDEDDDGDEEGRKCSRCAALEIACTFDVERKKRGPHGRHRRTIERERQREDLHAALEAILRDVVQLGDASVSKSPAGVLRDELGRRLNSDTFENLAQLIDAGAVRSVATTQASAANPRKRAKTEHSNDDTRLPAPPQPSNVSSETADWLLQLSSTAPAAATAGPSASWAFSAASPAHSLLSGGTTGPPPGRASSGAAAERTISVNEDGTARLHPPATGLDLVVPRNRVWRWPYSDKRETIPALTSAYTVECWPLEDELVVGRDTLPGDARLFELLETYWHYVHPHWPGVYKELFSPELSQVLAARSAPDAGEQWRAYMRTPLGASFLLMLFSMLSAAAVFTDSGAHGPHASDTLFQHAMQLLGHDPGHRASTNKAKTWRCQALILLAYREFGLGLVYHSHNLTGNAVRLAQDISLFRDSAAWGILHDGSDHELLESQKRIWYSCLKLDSFLSALRGHAVMIRHGDYDTPLPSVDEPDEHARWRPLKGDVGVSSTKARVVSTFNASAQLSQINSRVLGTVYPVCDDVLLVESARADASHAQLARLLGEWRASLPPSLHAGDLSPAADAASSCAPPHVLDMHAQAYCVAILLHRPLIKRTDGQASALALQECTKAAEGISAIVSAYERRFGFSAASHFLFFYAFNAALIYLYRWNVGLADGCAPFEQIISWTHLFEKTWPGAAGARNILSSMLQVRSLALAASRPPSPPPSSSALPPSVPECADLTSQSLAQEQLDGLMRELVSFQWWSPAFVRQFDPTAGLDLGLNPE